jgi:CRISPR-associated protein Cas2
MYVILVYDIGEERVDKVRRYLSRYLPRVQNSVFEGETSEAKLARLKAGLAKIIAPDTDAVLLWVLRDAKWADRQIVGKERFPISNVV